MKLIGITGGIASGKSLVTQMLRDMGHRVVCADEIARDVVEAGTPAYRRVVQTFGPSFLNADGSLNRQKIAETVFTDPALKKKLEAVIHPAVRREIQNIITQEKQSGRSALFLDIPLLFEAGWEKICDATLCVFAPEELQIERHIKRSGHTREHTLNRIRSQMPLIEKLKKSDHVLNNDKTPADLHTGLKAVLKKILD